MRLLFDWDVHGDGSLVQSFADEGHDDTMEEVFKAVESAYVRDHSEKSVRLDLECIVDI